MPAEESKSRVLLALVAIASLSSAAATLWTAASTGSAALFAIGVLFLAAGASQALMLLGLSSTPHAEGTPARQSVDLYLWSFVAALILFSLGAGVAVYEGIGKITDAPRILLRSNNATTALAVAFALAVAARVGTARIRAAAPVLVTTRIETAAALAGLAIAGLGVSLAYAWDSRLADGAAAILVGLVAGTVAAVMGVEIRRLLSSETHTSESMASAEAAETDASKIDAESNRAPAEQPVHEPEVRDQTSARPAHAQSAPATHLSRRARKRREQQQRRHPQQGSGT